MEQAIKWHEMCKGVCRLYYIELFVIVNSDGMKINVDANIKN